MVTFDGISRFGSMKFKLEVVGRSCYIGGRSTFSGLAFMDTQKFMRLKGSVGGHEIIRTRACIS